MAGFRPSPSPRSLEALVAHQVQRWALEEHKRRQHGPFPCIAMSRLPASGATEVGRRVAERLGFGFFGIEIVDQIAREHGIQRDLVADVDEHVRNAIDRWVLDAFRQRSFNESDYLRGVVRTVATLGERGLAVLLGRGSPFILEQERTLRVLVVAPRAWRVARRAGEAGISSDAAAQQIERDDETRRRFLRADFGVEPDDPSLYDLVVNTAGLGIEGAVELIVRGLRQKFPRAG